MALTRPSLEARAVVGGALATLAIALPMVIAVEWLKGDDLAGEESSLWLLAVLVVVAAFVIGGGVAGARRPETALGHSVAAAALAFAVLVIVALVRRAIDGLGLPVSVVATFVLLAVVCLSMGVLGGYLAMRVRTHRAGRRRSRTQHSPSGRPGENHDSRSGRPAGPGGSALPG